MANILPTQPPAAVGIFSYDLSATMLVAVEPIDCSTTSSSSSSPTYTYAYACAIATVIPHPNSVFAFLLVRDTQQER
ncbi:hypothetical protein V8E54_005122 [Elaphomyces granulatus]